jgi:hypothetical protein
MAKYKFDGKKLKYNGKTIAEVNGDRIYQYSPHKQFAEVRGDRIYQYSPRKQLAEVKGEDVYQYSPRKKIADMDDIRKVIDGPGGVTLVALWYFFVR